MPKLLPLFPPHKIYVDVFFGSGSAFFYKPKAQYNIVNDLDSDVFNLFQVVMNQKEELEKAFYLMPIHSDLLDYWKKNKETDPIKKALRFLFLSNFTYMGKPDTLRYNGGNGKQILLNAMQKTFDLLANVEFMNCDFRKVFSKIPIKTEDIKNVFIYLDPPYVGTVDNYSNSFTKQDSIDLFDCVIATGCKFGMSEFDNPFILDLAKKHNLNIHYLGERQNLKNRRSEIYICNYTTNQLQMF